MTFFRHLGLRQTSPKCLRLKPSSVAPAVDEGSGVVSDIQRYLAGHPQQNRIRHLPLCKKHSPQAVSRSLPIATEHASDPRLAYRLRASRCGLPKLSGTSLSWPHRQCADRRRPKSDRPDCECAHRCTSQFHFAYCTHRLCHNSFPLRYLWFSFFYVAIQIGKRPD